MPWWGHGTLGEGLATPQVMSWWILTLGGLLVWLRWLKKPMKPLAWWRSPKDVLEPTVGDLMTLQPLLGSWSSCIMMMTSYGPWHAMELMNMSLVWWRSPWRLGTPDEYLDALVKVVKPMRLDGMMKAPTHMWWHLDTCLHALWHFDGANLLGSCYIFYLMFVLIIMSFISMCKRLGFFIRGFQHLLRASCVP